VLDVMLEVVLDVVLEVVLEVVEEVGQLLTQTSVSVVDGVESEQIKSTASNT
jgi:hypothetical protein